MAFTYPITLNLEKEKCVVIGGGKVAERKVVTLLEQKAQVTVISPDITETLQSQLGDQLVWIKDVFQENYLQGAFLVIAATNHRKINQTISQYCRENKILVNVIDAKEESNFTVNSYLQQGDLMISVSTNGVSPAIAKRIREQLEAQFGIEYKEALNIAKRYRMEALCHIDNEEKRRAFLQELAQLDLVELLKSQTVDEVEKRVKLCLLSYWD